ncbi:hypothetical protein FHT70_000338 [Rhizobium sp. BK049]|nr:hypothetical protein [Rhizobium sp. BK049]
MFVIGTRGVGDRRMAMLLRRLDHEINKGPGDAEFGRDVLLRHAVQAVADEGVVGALRQRLERSQHVTQGLCGNELVKHRWDGSRDLPDLIYRPVVVRLMALAAALIQCKIIDHPEGIADGAANTVDIDPISFDDSVLKYVLGV